MTEESRLDQNTADETIIEIPIPEYAKDDRFNKEVRDKYRRIRRDICNDLGILTHPHLAAGGIQIFEILVHFARNNNNQISFNACLKQVVAFGTQRNVAGINTELTGKNTMTEMIKLLAEAKYVSILAGTPDLPRIFAMTDPRTIEQYAEGQQEIQVKQKVFSIVSQMLNDLNKNSSAFPMLQTVQGKLKEENPDIDLSQISFEKYIIAIDCKEMTNDFFNQASESNKLVHVNFRDKSSILLLSRNIENFFQENLSAIVMEYIDENRNLNDDIRLFYSKKNKKVPPIESVFEDQLTEDSFFWIKAFHDIVEEKQKELQGKSDTRVHTHQYIYHVSSLLYQYTLTRREVLLKNKAEEEEKTEDLKELVKEMLKKFADPWKKKDILDYLNSRHQNKVKYLVTEINDIIQKINEMDLLEKIHTVITVTGDQKIYYVHKYRFYLTFFSLLKKEKSRLIKELVDRYSGTPSDMPRDDKHFDRILREGISPLAQEIFKTHIPDIAAHIRVNDNLLPDDVTIQSGDLTGTTLMNKKANKDILNTYLRTVYTNKSMQTMRPLHSMLSLKLADVKKLVRKKIPLYKRSKILYFFTFRWIFDWILNLFANSHLKEIIRTEIMKANREKEPTQALDKIISKYTEDPEIGHSQIKMIKEMVRDAKASIRHKEAAERRTERLQEKQDRDKMDSMKNMQVASLETVFGDGGTLEEMEEYWAKKCFVKLGDAKNHSENAIKSAIKAHFRRHSSRKVQPESVKMYARKIVIDNRSVFSDIHDTESLIHYVEIIIAMAFRRKLRGN